MTTVEIGKAIRLAAGQKFAKAALNSAAYQGAFAVLNSIRERTMAGYDASGRKFKKYSKGYQSQKLRRAAQARGKTQFAADGMPSWMRLSGRMFNDMYVKSAKGRMVGDFLEISAQLDFRTNRSKEIAGYQLGAGRKDRIFWGASKQGTVWAKRERKAVEKAISETLKGAK